MPLARVARVIVGADTRGLDRALGKSRQRVRKWGRRVGRDMKNSIKGAFKGLTSVAGLGGVAGLAFAGREVLDFEKRLVRLGIQAGKNDGVMLKLKQRIFDVGVATGEDPGALLDGMQKFVSLTGDFDVAAGSLETFATVASASGASMEDVAATAAALKINMGFAADEMDDAFNVLLDQGKRGAIELKEMSTLASKLTPMFSKFSAKGTEGLGEMGALLQIVRGGFGTAEEAATGFSSVMDAILKNSEKLEKEGVNIFSDKAKTQFRDLKDIIFEIGDKVAFKDFFEKIGRKEAVKGILQITTAGRAQVENLEKQAKLAAEQNIMAKDAARFQASAAGQMKKASANLKKTMNETIAKNAKTIAKAFQAMAAAVKFIVENPITSALGFGALKFGPGYLQAALGGGVLADKLGKGSLEKGAVAAGGKMGLAAQAGLVAGAGLLGVAIGTQISNALDPITDKILGIQQKAAGPQVGAEAARLRQLEAQGVTALGTPEELRKQRLGAELRHLGAADDPVEAQKKLIHLKEIELRAALKSQERERNKPGVLGVIQSGIGLFGGDTGDSDKVQQARRELKEAKQIIEVIVRDDRIDVTHRGDE